MSVFAWADLHGRLDLFQEGLKYIKPKDTVYFLGDAADRGPDGWEIIKAILNDKRFIYIKGNHEDLLVKSLKNIAPEKLNEDNFHWNNYMDIWFWNGGQVTYDAIINDTNISAQEKVDIINKLSNLPFLIIYENKKQQHIILSHSGYDMTENGDEEKYIWDRTHLMFFNTWNGKNNEIIVHGHTPIELMIEEQAHNIEWFEDKKLVEPIPWKGSGVYWYGKHHKVNIDTGAVWNNNSVLLNLNTWEEIIINN